MEHGHETSTESRFDRVTPRICRACLLKAAPLLVTTGLVLLFVGACNQPAAPSAKSPADSRPVAAAEPSAVNVTPDPARSAPPEQPTIAYYFHRTLRCPTCLAIEKQSKEAVANHFKDALRDGRLQWRVVNIEEPDSAHFEKDFQLQAQALVLVKMRKDKIVAWKNLPKVWELVEDPGKFDEYVRSELAAFLGS